MATFADLEKALGSLQGKTISGARPGVGSFLTLDFVSRSNELLWTLHASWRVVRGTTVIGGSSNDQIGIALAAQELADRSVLATQVTELLDAKLSLSGGVSLEILNTMREPSYELWSLFLHEKVFSTCTGGKVDEESRKG